MMKRSSPFAHLLPKARNAETAAFFDVPSVDFLAWAPKMILALFFFNGKHLKNQPLLRCSSWATDARTAMIVSSLDTLEHCL